MLPACYANAVDWLPKDAPIYIDIMIVICNMIRNLVHLWLC
jgi:hypothetical protein